MSDRPNAPEAPTAQIAPADEMAAIRDQIKALQEEESILRTLMLTDKSARTGNRFVAEVVVVTQQRTDLKELRKMHAEIVEAYTFPQKIEKVELRVIDDETGEIMNRPRQRRTEQ